MGYCFSCGRLRDTTSGFCGDCLPDMIVLRKTRERKASHDRKEERYKKGPDFELEGIRKSR